MCSKSLVLLLGIVPFVVLPTRVTATTSLSVSPGNPTSADTLSILVYGGFPDMCWNPIPAMPNCEVTFPDTLDVTLAVNYCRGQPSCNCAQFPVGYSRICKFGPMPTGIYVARFTEQHINPADPLPTVMCALTFAVSEATPTLPRSWGALKIRYR